MAKSKPKSKLSGELKEEPLVPFIFVLVGGIVIFIGGIFLLAIGEMSHLMLNLLQTYTLQIMPTVYLIAGGIIGLVSGAVIISLSAFLYTQKVIRFKVLLIFALGFAIISLLSGGGFFIGFALVMIGIISGLFRA